MLLPLQHGDQRQVSVRLANFYCDAQPFSDIKENLARTAQQSCYRFMSLFPGLQSLIDDFLPVMRADYIYDLSETF